MRCLPLFLLLGLFSLTAHAQVVEDDPVPRLPEAELVFDQALEAFNGADYGMSFRRFWLVVRSYPLNRKTSAAWLMAARSLYRNGEYDRAAELLDQFEDELPTSRYLVDVRLLRGRVDAQQRLTQQQNQVVQLGILLPMRGQASNLSQAMFNGIRLAVEEHNANSPASPVRMIFRAADDPRAGVRQLNEAGADAIIGPLFTDDAEAAAREAEMQQVPLLPPVASGDDVAQDGRLYTFQINPSFSDLGRMMADFAANSLRLESFGIVTQTVEGNPSSIEMADGFETALRNRGVEVGFVQRLETPGEWFTLVEDLGAAQLSSVEALYMPLPLTSDRASSRLAGAILNQLDEAGLTTRILGNTEWADLPFNFQLGDRLATYPRTYHVDVSRPEVQRFQARYRELASRDLDPSDDFGRLAFTGYDVARYLIQQAEQAPGRALESVMLSAPRYDGLSIRIDFAGSTLNQGAYYFRYRGADVELLR
ncbi:MAG: ABC transporter substrate-binding protein [Rhodothermales bacterium]